MTADSPNATEPNKLIHARSAYLRSAAYQPVHWQEFGEEAFAAARLADKPVLLDIGAVWCHWCHVIDRESYDDPEIAALINELFVAVKVDRDERPDIDARYQAAVQAFSGQGGWPLTVFLTPDGEPFYGGTYFPPDDRYGRTGLRTLLPHISEAYRHRRSDIVQVVAQVNERLQQTFSPEHAQRPLLPDLYLTILEGMQATFDPEQGGFERGGPKFPHSGALELAMDAWYLTGDSRYRTMLERTLTRMAEGGIYDQLGGGFHRYATDSHWRVPHFEKMAYDNALLLINYLHAARAFDNVFFEEIAVGTLQCLLRDFTDHQLGGFFSTQDADINLSDDGDYWTWSFAEVADLLTAEEFDVISGYYGLSREGDMPESQRNVLHLAERPEQLAERLHCSCQEITARLQDGRGKLLQARNARIAPFIDTTKYTNWNALIISALLEAGALLEHEEAIAAGLRGMDVLIRDAYTPEYGFHHLFHGAHGADLPGFLEDQAYATQALLDAHAVSGEQCYLELAIMIMTLCREQYWDAERGGYRDVADQHTHTGSAAIMRQTRIVGEDMPTPSPNAIIALNALRLSLLLDDDGYRDIAAHILLALSGQAPAHGPYAGFYGLAALRFFHPPAQVTIIGEPDSVLTCKLRRAALRTFRPGKVLACYPPGAPFLPYPAPPAGEARAYLCIGASCTEPTDSPEKLEELLTRYARPSQGQK